MKVLVVDDSKLVRLLLVKKVRALGLGEVIEAADGSEALGMLEGVDIVLTDMEMPGMGGIELTQKIRELGKDVPILLITAHEIPPNEWDRIRAFGIDDYVDKAVTGEDLRDKIQEVLAKRAS